MPRHPDHGKAQGGGFEYRQSCFCGRLHMLRRPGAPKIRLQACGAVGCHAPRRVQLSRKKGWKMPPNTVSVARPTRWGNPFEVGQHGLKFAGVVNGDVGRYGERSDVWTDVAIRQGLSPEMAVALYRQELTYAISYDDLEIGGVIPPEDKAKVDELREALAGLAGKNLACWCPIPGPCHADVLLILAARLGGWP